MAIRSLPEATCLQSMSRDTWGSKPFDESRSDFNATRERRIKRQEEAADSYRGKIGRRNPEWQCNLCYSVNYMEKKICRGDGCEHRRDHKKDKYFNEYGRVGWWPEDHRSPSPPTTHRGSAGNARPHSPAQSSKSSRSPSPQEQLKRLRAQLAYAEEHKWSTAPIDLMRAEVAAKELEMEALKPLGQRLDAKRGALRKACDRVDNAHGQIAQWQTELRNAKYDVQQLEQEVNVLTLETAGANPDPETNVVQALTTALQSLAHTVEKTWVTQEQTTPTGAPSNICTAMNQAQDLLAQVLPQIQAAQQSSGGARIHDSDSDLQEKAEGREEDAVMAENELADDRAAALHAKINQEIEEAAASAIASAVQKASGGPPTAAPASPKRSPARGSPKRKAARVEPYGGGPTQPTGAMELAETLARARRLVSPIRDAGVKRDLRSPAR